MEVKNGCIWKASTIEHWLLGTFFLLGVWKIDFEGLQQIYRGKLNHIDRQIYYKHIIESLADVLFARGY